MNTNNGGNTPSRTSAGSNAEEREATWAVLLMALAIIGVMYIYDQAFAQATPPRPQDISCNPPAAVVSDAETFRPRS